MRATTRCAVAVAVALSGLGPASGARAERDGDTAAMTLPVTIDRVWYRGGKNGATGGKRRTGDLTITLEALEFSSPKERIELPLRSIRAVSLGKISGDVDTDWVVLAVGPVGATRLVSFRDGSKLGYGGRTEQIHATVRQTLRLAGAGPYDVPPGFEPYDALDDQFTLAVPRGWTVFHASSVNVDGKPIWGRTVFSEPSREPGARKAFTLDRRQAPSGMRCSGFSSSAERKLVEWLEQEPPLATAREILEGPEVEPFPMGDCIGRRLRARLSDESGSELWLDARAVSDDRTLFLLLLRSRPSDHAEAVARFDLVIASFQPAVAR